MMEAFSYIGFEKAKSKKSYFKTFNPILNQENDTLFYEVELDEILEICDLSTQSFLNYKKVSSINRSNFLKEIVKQIEIEKEELMILFHKESGLSFQRAKIELTRTINQILNFATLLENDHWRDFIVEKADHERIPPKPNLIKYSFPIGPVLVFGAGNFPFAYSTIGGDVVSALAAGCPVVYKVHPYHAETSSKMAECILNAAKITNMPNGVFSHILIKDLTLTKHIILNKNIKAIGFTGSIKGGEAIIKIANDREDNIPVFAEMGSVNPVFIDLTEGLNFDEWTEKLSYSITNDAGQFCTQPGLIFIEKSEFSEKFKRDLIKKVLEKNSFYMYHPNIFNGYNSLIEERKNLMELHQQVFTGENKAMNSTGFSTGKMFLENEILQEEVFGPFSLIVECENFEELLNCINSLRGQLTGTIIQEKNTLNDKSLMVLDILTQKVGRIILNGVPTGVEVVPAMQHGGAYPSSSDSRFTAVGNHSIKRFTRNVAFQNFNHELVFC